MIPGNFFRISKTSRKINQGRTGKIEMLIDNNNNRKIIR
jgi:hypothetical protein